MRTATIITIFGKIGRILFWIILLFVILLGSAAALGYYYQNDVKSYIISQLNKQLNTEIIVDGKNIDFTIIKSFPLAAVNFKHVIALDAIKTNPKDTLFKAHEISLQFNIVDVFNKNYHIKKIKINNGNLSIRIDENGNDNYHFWKSSENTDTTAFSFALEKIDLNNIEVLYKNFQANQSINVVVNQSKLSGNFSDKHYSLKTKSNLFINKIKIDKNTYLRKKNIDAELALEINNTTNRYDIQQGKIKIENLLFEVLGSIENNSSNPLVNLNIRGKNMDIRSVLSLIPNQYKDKIKDYESNGEFYFNATINGEISDKYIPKIRANFGINNADITHITEHFTINNVNLKGRYSSGGSADSESSTLELIPFSARINQGSIAGELTLHNLNNPSINAKIKADLSLEEIQKFIHIDTIESINGQLKMDAQFNGKWTDINYNTYKETSLQGNLTITDMNMKLKNNTLDFTAINGEFNFDNNDLIVNQLKGKVLESDFELKGIFKNSTGFVFNENEDITIDASLNSKNINLNELLANKEENSESSSKYKLKFSEHVNVKLQSNIDHISFRKFEANDINGLIILKNKRMMADPIRFSTMNGNITLSGLVDAGDSTKLLLSCVSEINKINVTKLFTAFENFTQTSITNQNIKGVLSAKIELSSELSPDLTMDMSKLTSEIDMTIENGELNNVESMKNMSRFIELSELNAIKFATLKNSFEIKNRLISFPKMEIKSNAINIYLSGTHTFNNDINYKIKLSLNELLSKKAIKAKKQNEEFGEVTDDGLGRTNIYLSMTGTVDKPIIKYDTKSAIQNIKLNIKEEKNTLKTILKEEFGLFKKDSTIKSKAKKEDSKFKIKWEEADEKVEDKKALKMPKKKEDDDY